MFSAREDDLWPVSCANCKAVVSSRINRTPLVCAKCGSAEVTPLGLVTPWLDSKDGERISEQRVRVRSADRVLDDSLYPCPQCGAVALRVATKPGILFD
jgi:predicted RNA-binding Zn-ribbon protein involved in translation (DUF1610 family)